MIVFAIDPGVAGTGWAVVGRHGGTCGKRGVSYMVADAGNLYSYEETWEHRTTDLTNQLRDVLDTCAMFDEVVCEFPTYMEGKSVSSKKDSTIKMAMLCGRFVELVDAHYDMNVRLYIPQQWKGTMSKGLVERRCRKHVDFTVRAHAIDAIGIGLKHLGAW